MSTAAMLEFLFDIIHVSNLKSLQRLAQTYPYDCYYMRLLYLLQRRIGERPRLGRALVQLSSKTSTLTGSIELSIYFAVGRSGGQQSTRTEWW